MALRTHGFTPLHSLCSFIVLHLVRSWALQSRRSSHHHSLCSLWFPSFGSVTALYSLSHCVRSLDRLETPGPIAGLVVSRDLHPMDQLAEIKTLPVGSRSIRTPSLTSWVLGIRIVPGFKEPAWGTSDRIAVSARVFGAKMHSWPVHLFAKKSCPSGAVL